MSTILLLRYICASAMIGAIGMILPAAAQSAETPVDEETRTFVQQKVRPLLEARCYACHGPKDIREEEDPAGGLLLTSQESMLRGGDTGPALIPGDPNNSLLMRAVAWEDLEMPPDTKMPPQEIEILKRWIQEGAPWYGSAEHEEPVQKPFPLLERKQAHWCWEPLTTASVPPVADPSWPRNTIDHFLAAQREQHHLLPSPDADRRTLIRRLYFAVIGLPPSSEEVAAFVADPADDDQAISSLVLKLLQSPHFGERWGRHWLDLVRYAESRGHEYDYITPNPWHYRDYVIRALNEDIPFDDFFIEHVAGDLLNNPRVDQTHDSNESILATGFWYLGDWIHSPTDIRADEMERIDNQLDVFGRAFLGLTIACARCHDHKFDAISSEDYYALAGYLQSSSYRQVRFDTMLHNQNLANRIWQERQNALDKITPVLQAQWDKHQTTIESELLAGLLSPEDSSDPVSWSKILYDAKNDPSHPLYLIAKTAAQPSGLRHTFWKQQINAIRTAADRGLVKPSAKVVFDYKHNSPLRQDGFAFGPAAHRHGQLWLDETQGGFQLRLAVHPVAAHDLRWPALALARGTQKDQGFLEELNRPGRTLKTDTFEIDHAGHCLIRGQGSLQIVVASHRMINGPLHNDLVQKFNTDGKWKWITFDLSRYDGERAHIEFVPEAGQRFELRSVATGPTKPTLQPMGEAVALRVDETDGDSFEDLAHAYATKTIEGLEAGIFGTTDARRPTTEALSLANWALTYPHIVERLSEPIQATLVGYGEHEDRLLEDVRTHSRTALAIWDGDAEDENVLIRGSSRNPGALIPRRNLDALGSHTVATDTRGSGRLELARSLANPELNPLLSRVIVNRVWHHLFGRGIVKTVDNFGFLGSRPSHPELLDHLALEFIEDDWSLKRLIYKMVTSRTFRQQSRPYDAQADEIDPENIYLSHMPLRRLEGESIRDAILKISGRLDPTLGGRSVPIHLTKFTTGRGRPASGPLDGNGRRSIYLSVRRNFLSPWMLVFDTPIPLGPVGRRNQSNVPAQPLALLNDPFVIAQSQLWAQRILQEGETAPEQIIQRFYQDAFARLPTDTEVAVALRFLQKLAAERKINRDQWHKSPHLWGDYAHVLLNAKEFIYLP